MRKISEMYERSGGASWKHVCKDCQYYQNRKIPICIMHGDDLWNPKYVACKFWSRKEKKNYKQLSIFDFL